MGILCPVILPASCVVPPRNTKFAQRRAVGSELVGHKDRPSAPRSPWQNPYVERVIGSIRRECLDHVIVLSERHLKRILRGYFAYYHE
jgi:hypothetical protein